MIRPEQVFLAVEPLDMRWGAERLSQHVQQLVGRSPCDGTAYAFTNRDRTRLKLLIWDGTGVWLCQRRLHAGRFRWPAPGDQGRRYQVCRSGRRCRTRLAHRHFLEGVVVRQHRADGDHENFAEVVQGAIAGLAGIVNVFKGLHQADSRRAHIHAGKAGK
ncbi:hypothetical protein GCM10011419_16170 [Vogesella fluminis]|uniref:Transposase n=1 Tax=Vogesella fluminis TaxID=1069161 RepID=A0ABQ3HD48_9NEIS|nr:hypothetical protein GCM10011419_16170 [Vogesella fluminis]